MIDSYLKDLPERQRRHPYTKESLQNIQFIVERLISKYSRDALFNTLGQVNRDLVYGYGLILKLEGQLPDSPSPVTIRKHVSFIERLLIT